MMAFYVVSCFAVSILVRVDCILKSELYVWNVLGGESAQAFKTKLNQSFWGSGGE